MAKKTLLFGVLLCLAFFIPQSVQAAWTIDLTPPGCEIGFSPNTALTTGILITTFFSAVDPGSTLPVTSTLQKDGVNVTLYQQSPGYYSYSWTNTQPQHIFRVNNTDAAGNGTACQATFTTTSTVLDGGWSNPWGSCSDTITGEVISCGPGKETRYCNTPPPANGGAECARSDGTLTTPTNRTESRPCFLSCTGSTPTSYSVSGTMYISATSTPYTGGFTVTSSDSNFVLNGDANGQYLVTKLPTTPINGSYYQFTFSVPSGYRVTNSNLAGWNCGGTWPQYNPCPGPTLYGSINKTAFTSSPNLTGVNIFLQEISSATSAWIQVTGDVHSNTGINADGGP